MQQQGKRLEEFVPFSRALRPPHPPPTLCFNSPPLGNKKTL